MPSERFTSGLWPSIFLKSSRPLEPPLRPIPVEMDPDCAELVVSVSSEESVQLPLSVRSGDEKMI